MLRRTFAIGGTLLVAAALVFLTPSSSQARGGGGGHGGGGFHGGGFHGGGFHGGGFHYGGYHGGYNYGGYRYGGYRYGGYRYRPYYGGYGYYGYYPYYSNYYLDDSSPYYSPDQSWGLTYDPSPSSSAYQSSSFYPPSSAQDNMAAHLTVTLPEDAEIWFNGTAMTTTGSVREFTSPPLTPGKKYTYDVRARWNENGHEVTQTQQVEVTAGGLANVRFPVPSKTAEQASAGKRD